MECLAMFRSRILVDTLYYFSHFHYFTQHKGKKYLSVGLYELLQSLFRCDKVTEDPK